MTLNKMEENKGVMPESPAGEGETPQTVVPPVAKAEEPQKPPKGFVPYQALEEERRLRKEAEQEAERLKNLAPSEESDVFSDEGKALKSEISTLNQKLSDIERKEARREVENEFPVIKDKKDEFNEFLEEDENKKISIKKAAKLFLAEKGLLNSETPERKGLETPTSGGKKPEPGLSDEEKENIRKTDYRKYETLLRAGKI